MDKSSLKVGDKLYMVPINNKFEKPYYVTISKIGQKYIYIGRYRFRKKDFIYDDGYSSGSYQLYFSEEEYEKYKLAKKYWQNIKDGLYLKMSNEEIINLYNNLKMR